MIHRMSTSKGPFNEAPAGSGSWNESRNQRWGDTQVNGLGFRVKGLGFSV